MDGFVTGEQISFLTPDSGSDSDSGTLTISAKFQDATTNQWSDKIALNGFTFKYEDSKTPFLQRVYPSRSFGKDLVSFYGYHRVVSLGGQMSDNAKATEGEIEDLRIGEDRCDRTLINQQDLTESSWDFIHCTTSATHPAGKVDVTERTLKGTALKDSGMYQISTTNDGNFEHVIHPSVSSVYPTTGSKLGQDLVISGSNFSPDKSLVSVSVDGVDCDVTKSTWSTIECRLQEKQAADTSLLASNTTTTQVNGYIGGAGWDYERYDISALSTRTIQGFYDDLHSGAPQSVLN